MQLFSEWSGVNSRIMVSGGWPPVSLPDGRGSQGGRRLPEGGMPVLDREVIGDHGGLLAMAIVQYFAQVVAGDLTSVSGARPQSSKTRRSALAMLR